MKVKVVLSSLLSIATSAVHAASLQKRGDPLPPSQDPFYDPPAGYETADPGSILRSRLTPNPPSFEQLKENLEASYQLLYRTTNTSGGPSYAVTTVFVPHNADFNKVLSYQTFEDSAWVDCAPSYQLQYNSKGKNNDQLENLIMQIPLNDGIVVATPDYEGPNAAFTAGFVAAHGVLDGIRAILQSEDITGIKKVARVGMMGYSGGSLASGWASQLQPSYAPDLAENLVGTSMGGITPNITAVALSVNEHEHATLVPSGLMGLAAEYPEFNKLVRENLIPETADAFYVATRQCYANSNFSGQNFFDYFKTGEDALYIPGVKQVLDENAMGQHAPKVPMFWYHAEHDEVAPVEKVDELYDNFCSKGTSITYHRDMTGTHESEGLLGLAAGYNWMKDRLDGNDAEAGCHKKEEISNILDFDALVTFGDALFDIFLDMLNKPVGPWWRK